MASPPLSFPAPPDPILLSEAEEHSLALLAVRAVRAHCRNLPEVDMGGSLPPYSPLLKAGVFVTLLHEGELRGCLGTAEGREPLSLEVPRLARAAACKDSRFFPIKGHELKKLEIEITILGELTCLPNNPALILEGLKPDIHGVCLRCGGRSGLFLPQVARRLGWGPRELLEEVSKKAKLSRNAWRTPGTSLYAFTARSFSVGDLSSYPDSAGGWSQGGTPGGAAKRDQADGFPGEAAEERGPTPDDDPGPRHGP